MVVSLLAEAPAKLLTVALINSMRGARSSQGLPAPCDEIDLTCSEGRVQHSRSDIVIDFLHES